CRILHARFHRTLKRRGNGGRGAVAVSGQVAGPEAEPIRQPGLALRRDADGAALAVAPDPSELDEPRQQGDSQGAGKVMPPLGPVEAAARQPSYRRPEGVDLDSDLAEPAPAGGCNDIALGGVIGNGEVTPGLATSGDGDAEAPGEMVVAGAAEPQRAPLAGQRRIERADGRRQAGERLDRGCDLGCRQT